MKRNYTGKKILILGGASQHKKLVEAAKRLDVYTVVTDNIKNSPAKKIANKSYCIDIFDMEGLLKLCLDEGIDGVISTSLDPCQIPYVELCERVGYFCYGTKKQFHIMTNKMIFKKECEKKRVKVPPGFSFSELVLCKENIYPVIVKPVDSRGSRGQTICHSFDEIESALELAKENSTTGNYMVEKYIADGEFFQVTYFCVAGEPHLIRTVDGYCGGKEWGLDRVVLCAVSPSRYTKYYMETTHKDVVRFIRGLGIINGPVFMQGIIKDGKIFFFDPGLRFPGVDYERIYRNVFGIDLMEVMVEIALFGNCFETYIPKDSVWLSGKRAAILFPLMRPGKIGEMTRKEEIMKNKNIISYLPRYKRGDEVATICDIRRRHSEIDLLCESTSELKRNIKKIFSTLRVTDDEGKNMICNEFDVSLIF